MNKWIVIGFVGLFIAGCGGVKSKVKKGEIEQTIDQEMVTKKYVTAIGIGAADATLTNATQRRATSRNAAIVAAQYEMLSYVKGIELEGGILVERAIETDSVLQTKIDERIKRAEIVKTEWTNDDGCVVTIRLERKKLEEALGAEIKE